MPEDMQNDDSNDLESLQDESTDSQPGVSSGNEVSADEVVSEPTSGQPSGEAPTPDPKKPRRKFKLRSFLAHVNLYLLAFILLLVVAAVGSSIYYLNASNKQPTTPSKINSQALSTESLKQLANSDVTVGDSKQVLTVQSNAIFDGSVLLRSDVEIAGKLVVGDKLSLTGIDVSGESNLEDLKVSNNVAITHNAAVQGKLTVQGGISVNGSTSFNGSVSISQLNLNSLQLNGPLNLTHHISAGGSTPSRSGGTALGSGGTASISGSDTAGTISINTGSSPAAGCFITVNFRERFNTTPHVVITPVGSSAASLNYYVNRNTSGFSVCTSSPASSGRSFGFDYIAFD